MTGTGIKSIRMLLVLLLSFFPALAADEPKPTDTKPPTAMTPARSAASQYKIDPDSLPQESVPKGKLEGSFVFKSQVFSNTIRKYWVYAPAQYDAAKPACVLVFQDGHRAQNPKGVLGLPLVMDTLIAKNEMPVSIGILIVRDTRCGGLRLHEKSGCQQSQLRIRFTRGQVWTLPS